MSGPGSSKEHGADPFVVRHNAPVSIVHAAKASLKDPTRPMTPADFGRQLFSRDSEFSQNRPPSAYGMPSSKAFFDGGPKLPIAKLDLFARRSSECPSNASLHAQRSILESSSSATADQVSSSSARTQRSSHSGQERPTSSGRSCSLGLDAQQQQQQSQQWPQSWGAAGPASSTRLGSSSGLSRQQQQQRQLEQSKMGTAAETVAALKANLAAMELGNRIGCEALLPGEYEEPIPDLNRNSDLPPRPTTSRGRASGGMPQSSFTAEMASSSMPGQVPAPSSVEGSAQVLQVGDLGLSDSSDDDETYRHMYNYGPTTTEQQQQQQQQQQQKQQRPGSAKPPVPAAPRPTTASMPENAAGAPLFGPVVLDGSEEFFKWRAGVDSALRGLAAATNALAAATGSNNSGAAPAGGTPAMSSKEAMAQLQVHSGAMVDLAEHLRKQPAASKWLNSSSACVDPAGVFLTLREAIAEHVYRLMDVQNTELLLKACSVVLRVVKSRGPLLQAGKLLYRLSKDSNNDALFRRERLLEPMVRIVQIMVTSTASNPAPSGGNLFEPLVYYCGTLKNITNDAANQRALVKAGSLHVLSTALSIAVAQFQATSGGADALASSGPQQQPQQPQQQQQGPEASRGSSGLNSSASLLPPNGSPTSGPGQVAVQVTGTLRNLAVAPAHAPAFLAATCLAAMKAALRVLGGQQEVVLNIGRVLSKLSLSEQCQAALEADDEFAPLLSGLLQRYQHHRALLLRIAFTLGNLTTISSKARQQVASVPGALDMLIGILELYTSGAEANDHAHSSSNSASAPSPRLDGADAAAAAAVAPAAATKADRLSRAASREDCLVKLLRLIANLAIDTEVGPKLAASPTLSNSLLTLLRNHRYTCGTEEELVLNAVCCLTNVSFYQTKDSQVLAVPPSVLLVHITPLLLSDNEEAIVEAARVFGNFSRAQHAREYMAVTRVLEALVLLLDHSSMEVLYSVCGTLINFSADVQHRHELMRLGTPGHLLEVLERVMSNECESELEVATLCVVCKALFNLCSEDMHSPSAEGGQVLPALSRDELHTLTEVLLAARSSERLIHLPEVPEVTERLLAQSEQSLELLGS